MTFAQIMCLISAMVWCVLVGVAIKEANDGGIGGLFIPLLALGIMFSVFGAFL